MVLELIFKTKDSIRKPVDALILGIIIPSIAFVTSSLLFSGYSVSYLIGISTIFFTVVLSLPTFNNLYRYEEKIEVIDKKSFFHRHKNIIDFFIYFFIGTFIVFFILSFLFPDKVFSKDNLYGGEYQSVETLREKYNTNLPPPTLQGNLLNRIFYNNMRVLIISFVLSFFYGSGALFLITLNASVFASEFVKAIQIKSPFFFDTMSNFYFIGCNFSILFLHMIPEVSSYLVAAIAGGVLSKAVMKENLLSKQFLNVLQNVILLIILSFALVFIAAGIESGLSVRLISKDVCINYNHIFSIIFIVLVIMIVYIESKRLILSSSKQEIIKIKTTRKKKNRKI